MNPAAIANPNHFPVWTTLGLGFVLGLRHALDGDHLAAVSTFVTEERNLWRSSLIGVFWGLGHTGALLAFGLTIAAFRVAVSPSVSRFLEFAVGCMLVVLGLNVLRKLVMGHAIHVHSHEHDGVPHTHAHVHLGHDGHVHRHHVLRLGGRPFVVGVVHGLAGTAAIMLLVVGAIPSLFLAAGAILIFGVGSIGGMVAISLLMSLPLALATRRVALVERLVRVASGLFSLGFGIFLAWSVGVIQTFLH